MKAYFQEMGCGYGSRIYLSKDTSSISRLYEICKVLSSWRGADKKDDNEFWISFEFPIFHTVNFKELLHAYMFNLDFAYHWEDFLAYCAERKTEVD